MSGYWVFLIVLTGILIIFLSVLFLIKKTRRVKISPYEEALISLIEGKEEHALKKLQEAVFENSDNVEAYIRLAELLRKRNEPLKALQIHKYLLARRGLSRKTLNKIQIQTVMDYIELEAYKKATDILKKLLKSEPQNEQYYKFLLLNYEKSSLWNEAIETFRKMVKLFNYPKENQLNYDVYAAYEANKKGDKDWAEKVLKRILKIQPDNIPALIFTGDINYSTGNIDEAIRLYKKIISIDSESGYIIFPRLMKAYYEKGEFEKIEETYKGVLENIPEDNKTTIALAGFYQKMGRLSEAHELLKNGVETNPDSIDMNLILLLTELELEKSNAVSILRHIIDIYSKKELYECNRCGAVSKEYIIRCPKCGEWETYKLKRKK
ncbi:tetratricopeptide repeat protein [candidate division WOR-3 bacterium]|nr:tetratricopeptide repeat protein [candidate division WOR-3 bacterium]